MLNSRNQRHAAVSIAEEIFISSLKEGAPQLRTLRKPTACAFQRPHTSCHLSGFTQQTTPYRSATRIAISTHHERRIAVARGSTAWSECMYHAARSHHRHRFKRHDSFATNGNRLLFHALAGNTAPFRRVRDGIINKTASCQLSHFHHARLFITFQCDGNAHCPMFSLSAHLQIKKITQ